MKTKHTDGPCIEKDECPTDEDAANARLIAAAPEMLKALEELLFFMPYSCDVGGKLSEAIKAARNAIIKATGE